MLGGAIRPGVDSARNKGALHGLAGSLGAGRVTDFDSFGLGLWTGLTGEEKVPILDLDLPWIKAEGIGQITRARATSINAVAFPEFPNALVELGELGLGRRRKWTALGGGDPLHVASARANGLTLVAPRVLSRLRPGEIVEKYDLTLSIRADGRPLFTCSERRNRKEQRSGDEDRHPVPQ